MTVQFETIEENKVKLTVTVEAETFNKALDFAFKKVSKDVEIKGFRKGKVPRAIFEQRFGEGALYEDAINYVVSSEYPKAIDEAKIEPVAQPEIDFDYETIGKNKDFTFYATVAVKPEVTLGDYKGLEVTELSTEVTEADIDAEVNKLIDRYAELMVKEEAAENGDTVVIDYEGFKDGQPFEGGGATNYSLALGSNSFIPGFEEQLVGIKAGEDREVNVTFPEVYHSEELAGAEAVFKVHCHEVKTRQLPELTDEFVKELELENIETVAALREDAKTKLVQQKETNAKNALIDAVVDQAAENATINIPQEMVNAEAERMIQDTEQRLSQQGITLDLYLQYTGGTREGLLEQLSGDALKRIRYNLTLEAIANVEGIEATADEVANQMEEIAKAYNVTVEQVKMAFPNTADIENEIKVRKAVDFLVEQAVKKPE
jgi:trigger factor